MGVFSDTVHLIISLHKNYHKFVFAVFWEEKKKRICKRLLKIVLLVLDVHSVYCTGTKYVDWFRPYSTECIVYVIIEDQGLLVFSSCKTFYHGGAIAHYPRGIECWEKGWWDFGFVYTEFLTEEEARCTVLTKISRPSKLCCTVCAIRLNSCKQDFFRSKDWIVNTSMVTCR